MQYCETKEEALKELSELRDKINSYMGEEFAAVADDGNVYKLFFKGRNDYMWLTWGVCNVGYCSDVLYFETTVDKFRYEDDVDLLAFEIYTPYDMMRFSIGLYELKLERERNEFQGRS